MTASNKILVEQGMIVVNDVAIQEERDGFMVLEADMHSKYAEVGAIGGWDVDGTGVPAVFLTATEHTLKTNTSSDAMTMITLPARCKGWEVFAQTARYTVRIIAWRADPDREPDVIWLGERL
jgi:hypothetical protein